MRALIACLTIGWSIATLAALEPGTEVEVGHHHERLSNSFANWDSTYLDWAHRFDDRRVVYGSVRRTERFSMDDSELQFGGSLPLTEQLSLLLEASGSDTHRILPKWSGLGQLHATVGKGWGTSAALRYTRYASTDVQLAMLGLERYFSDFRGGYTLYSGKPEGAGSAASHRFELSWYYDDRSYVGLSYARGRELESTPAGILSTDVNNVGVSGRHWITPKWAIGFEAGRQQQGALYTRSGVRLGVRYHF